jgi:protein-disulfide isomerase
MKGKWLMAGALGVVALVFVFGVTMYRDRSAQQAVTVVQSSSDALVHAHAPVFGNPQAPVTIVEFFDPSCETCRAFHPVVKSIVNASFGQVRLVLRYAPLHQGSDRAVQILEAARLQGKYWPALERALADQPRWAAHGNPQPELIWESLADIGLDMARARADADSPAIADALKQDIADMRALRVRATPSFFVNGRPLTEFGEAQLRALVNEELAKVRKP